MLQQLELDKRKPEPEERRILDAEPEQTAAMGICIEAWTDLNTERSVGMAVGSIPVSQIRAWARDNGLDKTSTRILRRVIGRLDRDFLDGERSKRQQEQAEAARNRKG